MVARLTVGVVAEGLFHLGDRDMVFHGDAPRWFTWQAVYFSLGIRIPWA